jgi:hypothetical protein
VSERLKQQRDSFETSTGATTAHRDAGRSTLHDELDGLESSPGYDHETLFAHTANVDHTEADDVPALPDGEGFEARAAAAPQSTEQAEDDKDDHPAMPPLDALEVGAGDEPDAKQRIYGDNHHGAHERPFERKKKHAEDAHVAGGKYNREGIRSDKIGKNVAARPGVVIKTDHGRDGIFMLKHKHATRYLYVTRGGQHVADPFDIIDRDQLAPDNYKSRGRTKHENGNVRRLVLNPAKPRRLLIKGVSTMCVLTWVDGETAAWMPVDEIAGDRSKILRAARRRAKRWQPGRYSNNPAEIKAKSKEYVVRNDHVGQKTLADEGQRVGTDPKKPRVLSPGAKGGNNVSHYLNKDVRKEAFDANGERLVVNGQPKNITRSVVAVTMNLPDHKEPPIANDTIEAGQTFFVMRGKNFHREVPVFANGKHTSNKLQMWVFGHVAMRDESGALVPDPARRGWLPLRTLADKAHLETHDLDKQRIPNKDNDE